jgi:plastocyanin
MSDDSMMRDRLILPILIPVGALAFVLFLALVMSQVLLNVPAAIATAVAIMTAINLLIAFSVIAAKPDGGRPLLIALCTIGVVPLLLGAAATTVNFPGEEEEESAGGGEVTVAADNLAFETNELKIPADTAFTLVFNNQEAQPHNVAILESQGSATALFRGEVVTGPTEEEYQVDAIPAGEYYFQCDVHPTMSGTVVAEEGGGGGEGEAEGESAGGEAAPEE